jgi:uncharacterized protein (UPF0335 family)
MATNAVSQEPSPQDWTEAEKTELLEYHAYCLAQHNQCIENVETLFQEQADMKQSFEEVGDDHNGDIQAQYDDLARKASEQVALMAGYLDLLSFIEDEMDGCGVADF